MTPLASALALAPWLAMRSSSKAGRANDTSNPSGVRSVAMTVPGGEPPSTS